MKKVLSLVTALVIGGTSFFAVAPVKAAENENSIIEQNPNLIVHDGSKLVSNVKDNVATENLSLDELSSKYDLKDIDINSLPEGSNVLEFDSEEDLNKFLAIEDAAPSKVETVFQENASDLQNSNGIKAQAASSYSTVRKSTSQDTGFAKVNLKADIKVYSGGSFREIKGCKEWTDHTGFTFSLEWDERYKSHSISKDHMSVTVKGGGVLNYVIFVSGIGKFYSRPIDLKFTYKL